MNAFMLIWFFLFWLFIGYYLFSELKNIIQNFKTLSLKNCEIEKNTFIVNAEITELGINAFHDYKDITNDQIREKKLDPESLSKQRFYNNQSKAYIQYYYEIDNKNFLGTRIGVVEEESDINLIYKLSPGDKIDILVEYDNYCESYIRKTSEETIQNGLYDELLKKFPLILVWALSLSLPLMA